MMTSEELQLHRKLTGLRISQSHIRNALQATPRGASAKRYRTKLEQVRKASAVLTKRLKQFEKQKAAAEDPLRSTQAVLDHHLAAFDSGDVNNVLADYASDAVLITPEVVYRGHDQIRPVLQQLIEQVFSTCEAFEMMRQVVEGDVGYMVWSATSAKLRVLLATDTYIVRFGKIVAQTFTAQVKSKSARQR